MSKEVATSGALKSRERIMSFLGGGEVVLTDQEEKMLQRWEFADDLIRSRQYGRAQIVHMVAEKFSVSRALANKDIGDTHFVFGSTIKYNKNYLLILHIDECDKFIRDNSGDDEKLDVVMKMYDIRRKYVEMLDRDHAANDMPPVAIQFVMNDESKMAISFEDALASAKQMIHDQY